MSTLSSHIENLRSILQKPIKLSLGFSNDLKYLFEHLQSIHDDYQLKLTQMTDCLEPLELEKALNERNLFEENYQLSRVIRRIKADLLLLLNV